MKRLLSILTVAVLICGCFVTVAAEEGSKDIAAPIPESKVISPPLPTVPSRGTINITRGWNLIAIPVLPNKPYTVRQFIRDIEKPVFYAEGCSEEELSAYIEDGAKLNRKGKKPVIVCPRPYWKVLLVVVCKNGRFQRYPKKGISYNMVPGEAYFVYARYTGPRPNCPQWRPKKHVIVTGRIEGITVSLNLNKGCNGVSVLPTGSCGRRPLWTISTIARELGGQNVEATQIVLWNTVKQKWERHYLPRGIEKSLSKDNNNVNDSSNVFEGPFTVERIIRPDEGFFLICSENGLYIPGLDVSMPPVPPRPPVEIEKVGFVETAEISVIPGQEYVLRTRIAESGEATLLWLPLVAANEEISRDLEMVADDGDTDVLRGVLKTYIGENGDILTGVRYLEVNSIIQHATQGIHLMQE